MDPTASPVSLQRRREGGGALLEFALLLTLLITLLAGIVEFGRTFWYYDALSKATRNGARVMSASLNTTIASAAVPNARALVLDDLASAGVPALANGNIEIVCLNATMAVVTCTDGSAPAGVRVSIINYTMTLGQLVPFLIGSSSTMLVTLKPSTTMAYMK
ncbi:MAG: TadE/TadG family type IV pilus assembly protein [Telluria sp.]